MENTAIVYDFSAAHERRSSRMENQKQGHFALFRSLLSKDWATDTAKFALWVRIIGLAQYKPRSVEFDGVKWELQPGQLVTKISYLARKLKDSQGNEKSAKQVRDMLEFFAKEKMITFAGNRHGTVISVINYTDYQADFEVTKQVTNEVTNKPSNHAASDVVEVTKQVTNEVEESKKLLEQELNKTPLPPNGVGDGQEKLERRKPERIDYESFLEAYNAEVGDKLPHAVSANEKRKRRLKKIIPQLKTPNVDGFRAYVRAFVHQAKPFYFGYNDTGWTADLDYLLRDDTLTGVREGKFADRGMA